MVPCTYLNINKGIGLEEFELLKPYFQTRHYKAGQMLWSEGDTDCLLIVIKKGRVKVLRYLPDGSSILLYVFSPNTMFGFMPCIDNLPYPATAVAVDDLETLVIPGQKVRKLIEENHKITYLLLKSLTPKLRQVFIRIGDGNQGALSRVAAALILLLPNKTYGSNTAIKLPTPLRDFANDIGMRPETFSRAITQMVKMGILHRMSHPWVQVMDLDALKELASGNYSEE